MFATYALLPRETGWMPVATGICIAGARNSRTISWPGSRTIEIDPCVPSPLNTFGNTFLRPSDVVHCACG